MNEIEKFQEEVKKNIEGLGKDKSLRDLSIDWNYRANQYNYCYNFTWMGIPVIQAPQDLIALQEIIWNVKPDLIIETGIARGGSLIFHSSMLELMGSESGDVLGVDIDIRSHNYEQIVHHPMYKRISMIEGSSIDPNTFEKVKAFAKGKERILVCLDSNHTHDHVLEELNLYGSLVTKGSYCVVFDTGIEDVPDEGVDRPWGKGNNPKTAVWEYLKSHSEFEIDKIIENKILITAAPDGFLKKVQ